jgi:hypothetical protein
MADVVTLLAGVSANGAGPVVDAGDLRDEFTLFAEITGTVSAFSIQFAGSEDGTNFFNLGSAVTSVTAGTAVAAPPLARYLQATLASYSGTGTVTAKVAFGKT